MLIGARVTRKTDDGVPDVVWSFEGDVHVAFEAKTEKKSDGSLSKTEVLQANGHVNWVREHLAVESSKCKIHAVVVSPTSVVDEIARPHLGALCLVRPAQLREMAVKAVEDVREVRGAFSGYEELEALDDLSRKLVDRHLDQSSVLALMTSMKLDDMQGA